MMKQLTGVLVAAVCLTGTVSAQTNAEILERLEKLESEVRSLKKENNALRAENRSMATSAHASEPAPAYEGDGKDIKNIVTEVDPYDGAVEGEFKILFLNPSTSTMTWGRRTISNGGGPFGSGASQEITAEGDYDAAFEFGLNWEVAPGADLFAKGFIYESTISDSAVGIPPFNIVTDANLSFPPFGGESSASVDMEFDIYEAEFGYGQSFYLGNNFRARLTAGAKYLNFEHTSNVLNFVDDGALYDDLLLDDQATYAFEGIGPKVGLELEWTPGWGFTLFANGGFSALIGEKSYDAEGNIRDAGTGLSTATFTNTRTEDFAVVGALDLEAAVKYTYSFADNFSATLGGSYVVKQFLNAMFEDSDSLFPSLLQSTDGASSDVGLSGPAASIDFRFEF